jgi:hypothetical protein
LIKSYQYPDEVIFEDFHFNVCVRWHSHIHARTNGGSAADARQSTDFRRAN